MYCQQTICNSESCSLWGWKGILADTDIKGRIVELTFVSLERPTNYRNQQAGNILCWEKLFFYRIHPPPPKKLFIIHERERGGSLSKRKHLWKFWVKNKWTNSQNCVFFTSSFAIKTIPPDQWQKNWFEEKLKEQGMGL